MNKTLGLFIAIIKFCTAKYIFKPYTVFLSNFPNDKLK